MPDGARPARGVQVCRRGRDPWTLSTPTKSSRILHVAEFGRRLHWVRFRSFAGTGASGQVAPIPVIRLTTIDRLKSTLNRLLPMGGKSAELDGKPTFAQLLSCQPRGILLAGLSRRSDHPPVALADINGSARGPGRTPRRLRRVVPTARPIRPTGFHPPASENSFCNERYKIIA